MPDDNRILWKGQISTLQQTFRNIRGTRVFTGTDEIRGESSKRDFDVVAMVGRRKRKRPRMENKKSGKKERKAQIKEQPPRLNFE